MNDDPSPPQIRSRDRGATSTAILTAAKMILAEKGFAALGVNAVARDAGCDKQLVYRYFGGLDGLVDAIGEEMADWVGTRLGTPAIASTDSYATRLTLMCTLFIDALRLDPLMRAILAWEVSDSSPHVRRLSQARGRAMGQWMGGLRGDLVPPAGVDVAALIAVLFAAIQHLVLAGATSGRFAGLPVETDADWGRVKEMMAGIIEAQLG
jgi:AcrR family transcriptional regulator